MELSTTKGFAFFRHLVRQRTIYLLSNSQAAGVVTSSERLTWKCIRYEGGREGGFVTRSIEEDLRLVSLSLFFFFNYCSPTHASLQLCVRPLA